MHEERIMDDFNIISARAAKEIMDAGKDYVIIDARTEAEFAEGHILGAVLLPHDAIDADAAEEVVPDPDKKILIYCRTGKRAIAAAQKMVELDYSDVNVFGGIEGWPYEVEK